jgi:hypothetical protein
MPELGFLTMAFGHDRYFRQAENMALSLKRHMPDIPLAIVTDRKEVDAAFDIVIAMKPFSKAGVVHKVDLYNYSPFQETLFIDSDCIITRPFVKELTDIRQYDFTPVVGRYLRRGETDSGIVDLAAALDHLNAESFPKFNGGVYFFKKSSLAKQVFARANALRSETTALGIRDFDKGGPNEETLIGLALAELHVSQLHDDHGNLMRTPVGIIGKLKIDVLGGGCSFNKGGSFVTPAICHFPVEWLLRPEYKLAEYSLRNGRPPGLFWKTSVMAQHRFAVLQRRVKHKLSRIPLASRPSMQRG